MGFLNRSTKRGTSRTHNRVSIYLLFPLILLGMRPQYLKVGCRPACPRHFFPYPQKAIFFNLEHFVKDGRKGARNAVARK